MMEKVLAKLGFSFALGKASEFGKMVTSPLMTSALEEGKGKRWDYFYTAEPGHVYVGKVGNTSVCEGTDYL
jgi:hypothetical protein